MKVLVLGNSHVAALRLATLGELPAGEVGPVRRGPHEIHFYAIHGSGGPAMVLRGGRLVPAAGNARPFSTLAEPPEAGVDLAAFDAILLASAGLGADRGQKDHPFNLMTAAPFARRASDDLVSGSVFRTVLSRFYEGTRQWATIRLVRGAFGGAMALAPVPLPAPAVLRRHDFPAPERYGDATSAFLGWAYRHQLATLTALAAAVPGGLAVLPYPDPRWLEEGHTPAEYAIRDPWHMNGLYGERVLAAMDHVLT